MFARSIANAKGVFRIAIAASALAPFGCQDAKPTSDARRAAAANEARLSERGPASVGVVTAATPAARAAAVDPFPDPKLAPTDAAGANTNGARFGCSRNNGTRWHGGVDLKAAVGTSFTAVYAGKVTKVRKDVSNNTETDGVGNFVIVRSADPDVSFKYCHLSEVAVAEGATVAAGQVVGKTGKSGNAFSVPHPHLHIEVSTDHFATASKYVDPEPYLKTSYGNNPNPPTCP